MRKKKQLFLAVFLMQNKHCFFIKETQNQNVFLLWKLFFN